MRWYQLARSTLGEAESAGLAELEQKQRNSHSFTANLALATRPGISSDRAASRPHAEPAAHAARPRPIAKLSVNTSPTCTPVPPNG